MQPLIYTDLMKNHFKFSIFLSILITISGQIAFSQKYSGLTAIASDGQKPTVIFDGNLTGGKWQDANNLDNSSIIVDLGSSKDVSVVKIYWEAANAKAYNLSFSNDGVVFTNQLDYSDMATGNRLDVIKGLSVNSRYIKMQGVQRQLGYGYAIYEFQVFAPYTPQLTTVVAKPNTSPVNIGFPCQLMASGLDQVGEEFPLTNNTIWSVSANGTSITSSGIFTSTHAGYFQVTATNNGISGNTYVEVTPAGTNLALNHTATSSSGTAASAFDGSTTSRWESGSSDSQWIMIDLGKASIISDLIISWETANAKNYIIETSSDGSIWETLATQTNMPTGSRIDRLYGFQKSARFVRLTGTARNTVWGYSIWEFQVYGTYDIPSVDVDPPSAPGNLAANSASYATFLFWNASTDNVGVTSYKIFKDGIYEALLDGNSTSMTISSLNPGTTYEFCVKAYDAAGNESQPAIVTTTTKVLDTDNSIRYGIGNIAARMPATVSSFKGTNEANNAVDGNTTTRWESESTDNQWLTVDLGLKYYINHVIIYWEKASGLKYNIEVSEDSIVWMPAYQFAPSGSFPVESRKDDFTFSEVIGRYIRFSGVKRNSQWGYSIFEFEVYSPGSGPGDIPNPNPNPNPEVIPPEPASFNVTTPAQKAMITNTRRPTLEWTAVTGVTSYEVWVNITRNDYDWTKMGSLLDRFTKMGEVTTNSFTLNQDLSDRWTYKWYIVAKTADGNKYSDLGLFSVYLPVVTKISDGINIINGCRDLNKNGVIDPYEDWHLTIDERINDLVSKMTIEEKAYQMFYNAQNYPLSGWAFGPGTISDMYQKQKNTAGTRLGIPFVSCGDNIHGYMTTFPTQSTLAASRNLDNTYQCANMQRVEQVAVGARGVLGPLAEVGTKVLYPRIQEGCGEDADFAAAMVRALITGFQNGPELNPGSVLVTTKHWPGQGAGGEALVVYDAITALYHLKPWFAHMDAGGGSIMPGYSGSSYIDPGGSGAGDSKKIISYLRNTVGFDGVVCTDWLPWGSWINAANAGSDVMGGADPGAVGFTMADFIANVPESRINEAVRRILNVKFRLGVFEDPYGDPVNGQTAWYTKANQDLVVKAAKQSITLLKNNGVLPLKPASGSSILVTGSRATDGDSYRIWTSYFHAQSGAKTMYQAIKDRVTQVGANVFLDNATSPNVAIAIVGEPTYTHGTMWDKEKPWIHDAYYEVSKKNEYDSTTLQNVKKLGIPLVVVLIMPRPYIINDIIDMADAVVVAYRPGDGGGPALAQVLFGDYAPTGRLPWQLPRSMDQIGTDQVSNQLERWDIPFDLGATAAERQEIRSKISKNEHILPIYGDPLFQYNYGIQGYTSGTDDNLPTYFKSTNENVLRIYPNPSSNSFNVSLPSQYAITSLQLYNLSGTLVYSSKPTKNNNSLIVNVPELKNGAYLVKVYTNNGFFYKLQIIK